MILWFSAACLAQAASHAASFMGFMGVVSWGSALDLILYNNRRVWQITDMARQLRVEFPGAIYHATIRMLGDWKREENCLFEDEKDYERFLSRLAERVKKFNVRLFCFCMMTNHAHLILETPEGNLGRFMQSLITAYTVYFNLRHGRHGHLMDGRYKAKLVAGDRYLLALSRYVHLNPVKTGIVKIRSLKDRRQCLREYAWSTYPGYIGLGKKFDFVEYGPMLAIVGGKGQLKVTRYRAYVERRIVDDDEDFIGAMNESPRGIGDVGFRSWVDGVYESMLAGRNRIEDVAFRRTSLPLEASTVFGVLCDEFSVNEADFHKRRRKSYLRGVAARMLVRYAGMTQREAADALGVGTGAAISRQERKLAEDIKQDRGLRQSIENVEYRLKEMRQSGS